MTRFLRGRGSVPRRSAWSTIALFVALATTSFACRPQVRPSDGHETPSSIDFSAAGCEVEVRPGDDLVQIVNSTEANVFCIHAGTYDIGDDSIEPRSGMELIGAPVARDELGAIDAPTKIVGSSQEGVVLFEEAASDVLIANLDISGATGSKADDAQETKKHGRGINGNSMQPVVTILHSRIHNNDNNGVDGLGEGSSLRYVELDHNGSESFLGCCAGGIKSANAYTIEHSYVHDNVGFGVWQDVCGRGFVVRENRITANTQGGVRYEHDQECDGDALIVDNVVTGNNTSDKSSDAGGIIINSAPNAVVRGNFVDGNSGPGIIIGGNRGSVAGTSIEGNSMNGEEIQGCDQNGVTCNGNN